MLLTDLLEKEKRMSLRNFKEDREIFFEYFNNLLIVKTKDSYLQIGYSKNITKPYLDRPSEGFIQINLEKGRKNDILLNFLHGIYTKSKCVALDDLLIKYNQQAYSICIDIYPIQVNGNLFKLCIEGINEIFKILNLKMYFIPKFYNYCFYKNKIISDPDEKELEVSNWKISIVMKSSREALFIEKQGEGIFEEDFINVLDFVFNKNLN